MVIVDTTVWINYLAGADNAETVWLDRELGRQRIGLTDLILCELLQGLRTDAESNRLLRKLAAFEIHPTGGQELAIAAARNYRLLRSRGITVRKTIRCLIATFCIERQHRLLHRDRDFSAFEQHLGLQVVRQAFQ